MKKLKISGELMVFIGAVLWSLNSPLVKFIHIDSILVCGLRSVIASIAMCAFIRPKKLKWSPWMLIYVVAYAAVCLAVLVALKMTSAPIAVGMQYTSVVWIFILNLLIKRRFKLKEFFPVCIIIAGVVLFMLSGTDATNKAGNLLALTSGFTFMLMTLGAKKAAGDNAIGLVAIANVFTAIAVFVMFPSCAAEIPTMTVTDWLIMAVLGVVQVGGGYTFYTLGSQRTAPQKATVIALWELILGPIWVALCGIEIPSIIVIIGFAIIIAGMLIYTKLNPEQDSEKNA